MKILFICVGNSARSQMAEAIYNKLTNSQDASSAGTHVGMPGESLKNRSIRIGGSYALEVMKDNGYDIGDKKQTQLDKSMVKKYDMVISMAAKRYTPKWLSESPNYIYWRIPDPKGRSYKITDSTRKSIETRIRQMI